MDISEKLTQLGIKPFEENFCPFTEAEITHIEQRVGNALPLDYKSFLSTYGGAMFSFEVNCLSANGPLYFGSFYDFGDLSMSLENLQDSLPSFVIPMGDDAGDITFCLGVRGEARGKVFVYNNNYGLGNDADQYLVREEPVPDALRRELIKEIATSFTSFINSMKAET